jgi:hypothetical protein
MNNYVRYFYKVVFDFKSDTKEERRVRVIKGEHTLADKEKK